MRLSKTFFFDAAHHLPNYKGKCANVHGHRWKVEFVVEGEMNQKTGMAIDFKELKRISDIICLQVDHKDLNTIWKNPTAENIAEGLFTTILAILKDAKLIQVNVWESPTSKVSYP